MNIALLTDGIYPYVIGGMQKHSFYLAKYLAAAGHQVDLYHTNQSEHDINKLEFFSEAERENIRSFVVKFPQMGRSPGHYIRESYEYSKRVYALLRENKTADFIYVKGFAGWELLNQKSKGISFPPVGLNFHGYEMFQPQPSFSSWLQARFLLRPPVLFNVKNADYLFSYGGKITGLIESLGVSKKRILEIPTGIGAEWLNPQPVKTGTARKLVFVGRYERRKGLPELNGVLKNLLRKPLGFEFYFIGPIPAKHQVKSQQVKYLGEVNNAKELQNILRGMDVLVCPSHSEGMPNVIMEGLASGLAVVGTDVGAVARMVRPETGLLIPPSNPKALQKALEDIIQLPAAQLDQLKQNATKLVQEEFLWEKVIEQTVEQIRRAMTR